MFRFTSDILSKSSSLQLIRFASSASKKPAAKEATNVTTPQPIEPETIQSELQTDQKHNKERLDDLYRYLEIKTQANNEPILDSYEKFLKMAAGHLKIDYVKSESPFRYIKRRTLLASRHVHKKYRVQYEYRTYYRNVLFKNITGSTLETFLEYVERNVPEGLLFTAEKHRLGELPFDLVENVENKETT